MCCIEDPKKDWMCMCERGGERIFILVLFKGTLRQPSRSSKGLRK